MRHLAICLAVSLPACSDGVSARAPVDINVCTGHQLTPFAVGTGATGYLRELVDPRARNFFEIDYRPDGEVIMSLREDATHTLVELCENVVHPDMQSRPHLRDGRCVARLPPVDDGAEGEQTSMHRLLSLRVDIGPYEVTQEVPYGADLQTIGRDAGPYTPEAGAAGACSVASGSNQNISPEATLKQLTLRRRGRATVGEIRVHSMPQGELWRWLMAGQVDVAPMLPSMYRPMFEEMETIATFDLPGTGPAGLVFNTQNETWSNRDMRRKLLRSLDLDAIANAACEHPECRQLGDLTIDPHTEVPAPESDVTLPRSLRILVMVDDWNSVRAAELIRYQLRRRHNIDVHIDRCPVIDQRSAVNSGAFEITITPMYKWRTEDRETYGLWVRTVARYWNERLANAIETGAEKDVVQVMREEAYALPLFQFRYFAAIDKRFCTPSPKAATSWNWLGQLQLCEGMAAP